MARETQCSAVLSDDRVYRYRLERRWAEGALLAVCMLNPSTANESVDDPTIRRVMAFAKRAGFCGIDVVNLFAYRSAKPEVLRAAARQGQDIIGELNDAHIRNAAQDAGVIALAWGAASLAELRRGDVVALALRRMSRATNLQVKCWGMTRGGHPAHPLYLRGDVPLIDFVFGPPVTTLAP